MNVVWVVLALLGVPLMFLSMGLFLRNHQVYRHSLDMLGKIRELNLRDVALGKSHSSTSWRYEEFQKFIEATYDQMLYKFWKPLDSFYNDKSFLK